MGRFGVWSGRAVPTADEALPGRATPIDTDEHHAVHPDRRIMPPFPAGLDTTVLGLGCFWGAERLFWQTPGVHVTAAGYAGGHTPNPTYAEVCSGRTGHAEVVLVVFDPARMTYSDLLDLFWANHNPTQGMRQGPDRGTQYRSALYPTTPEQLTTAQASRDTRAPHHRRPITTEIHPLTAFYYAEPRHQQYLHKIPTAHCRIP
jgi:peptide-methionine (S)-S-oxide reductase